MKIRTLRLPFLVVVWGIISIPLAATEFHVATKGSDSNRGTRRSPLRTIQKGAELAQPGDVITVHDGVYRERVNPPRGGKSERMPIVYRAAPGEQVQIKGSEVMKGWTNVQGDVWSVTLPSSFFGAFNPYKDVIHGDWFDPRGRVHHTGAVYLNGDWMIEAPKLEDVLSPVGTPLPWMNQPARPCLLNVAWLKRGTAGGQAGRTPATGFSTQNGVQNAACTEGGECIGWIESGDWVRYDGFDFGEGTEQLEFRTASATEGGVIEARLGSPTGELLGTCVVGNTGGWQEWSSVFAKIRNTGGVKSLCLVFKSISDQGGMDPAAPIVPLWFAKAEEADTTIWAQFKGVNPNEQLVEINVRQTVFYPVKPGCNFITVRGFSLSHAATPWAPPTAEQIGLIGTHWSKGWIIESNAVSYSICSGIALGKHGDQWDNTSANSAEGYVKTIERGHARGWNRETIGHHVVRNNHISHCEQAGVVGSLGAAFSTVTGNTIHDIHVRCLFTGAEMAGIKFHGAIDSVITGNHIYRTCRGLWLDWMAQGTRVSANVFHNNADQDLFVEVDHGPFVVDNNLFLSGVSLLDVSEGGAYAHNLFGGRLISAPELSRDTPYHPAHSTTVAGLLNVKGGDNRFYNNILVGTGDLKKPPVESAVKDPGWRGGSGLWVYDFREVPCHVRGNVYYSGALPYARSEDSPLVVPGSLDLKIVEGAGGRWNVLFSPGKELQRAETAAVNTGLLGKAKVPGLAYENADRSTLKLDKDIRGRDRDGAKPTPGPFENVSGGAIKFEVR